MKKIMLFFAVATILAACNNDNEVLNETQYITEFKAVFGGADTRMTAGASAAGLKFAWEDGDKLYVFQADDPSVFYKGYEYDASTKTFKLSSGYVAMVAGTKYFAVIKHETSPYFTIEGEEIQFKAKLYISGDNDVTKIPLISDVFTADAEGTIAAMHHTVGVVEVPVKLDAASTYTTLKDLGFSIAEGYAAGDFIATPASPYFKEATNADAKSTWANSVTELKTTEATSIFIPVLPGTYTNPGLNYNFESKSRQKSLTGTLTVERGKVTKITEVQTLTLN
ncbi:MAG: hypothetical protein J6A40_06275 [Bacteroides sp.]|nr:hypothetical protein [Bacteroides sp.]